MARSKFAMGVDGLRLLPGTSSVKQWGRRLDIASTAHKMVHSSVNGYVMSGLQWQSGISLEAEQ